MTTEMTDRDAVLSVLQSAGYPMDDHEIRSAIHYKLGKHVTPSSARTRRAELVKSGAVVAGISTTLSPTGRSCQTWKPRA